MFAVVRVNCDFPNPEPYVVVRQYVCLSVSEWGRDSLKALANSTITGNFQVTVPRFVRELNSDNGDLLFFLRHHDEVAVKKER